MGSPVNNSRTVMVGDNLNSAIASTAIEELIQDASPQLGADLDCNGYDIQFDDGTGIEDDSGNKTLLFGKTVSATTYAKITNNATGTTGPLLASAGETNVDLRLAAAGTGDVKVTTGGLRVTSDNESISVGAGDDLALSHDGSNSTITGGVGKITVTPAAGSVLELDNSNCTVDNGSVQVTGDLDVDNISIDGNTISSTSGDLQLKAVSGSSITFQDDADATKQLTLDFATIGSGTERTWTFPNSDGTFGKKNSVDTVFPQILLTNSHDGKNAFTFTAGLFRMICENGLVVSTNEFENGMKYGLSIINAFSSMEWNNSKLMNSRLTNLNYLLFKDLIES